MNLDSFLEKIRINKELLSEFIKDPEKTAVTFFGKEIKPNEISSLKKLHDGITIKIENDIQKYYVSGEKKFINNLNVSDVNAADSPEFCTYLSKSIRIPHLKIINFPHL